MNKDEFQTVGLYEHNAKCYKEVKKAYESGENVVGIVHATGTGKSYNALQLAYDNKDKKIVYIVPSNGIIEHIEKIISNSPNLDFKRDFPNLELRTYQSLVSLSKEELKKIECDILIIDEFHHMGAPIWGAQVKAMIETHEDIKIFGMTAYTVRDRNTPYERDMANPNTNELFSNKIVSRYDLCDAMMDGILPIPVYKSSYITMEDIEDVENRLDKSLLSKEECKKYKDMLLAAKERIHEAKSIPKVISKNIKPKGKYIYFCPPYSETGVNDIETIKAQAMNWFKQITEEDNIEFYTSTSQMGKEGIKNREAFYEDKTTEGEDAKDKLRVMFAINQYNEGIHAPNVDGVILGRTTSSDIVFFEQIGRGLAVRGDAKEKFEQLAQYSKKELEEMCKSREIEIKENYTKEDLIERLIAPTIIDLSNNFRYIKELENNLKNRVREAQNRKVETNPREIKIKDVSFDIEMEDQDFYEMLEDIKERLLTPWEEMYGYAKIYYEHYNDLEVPQKFRTNDGYTYEEYGKIRLGQWVKSQRQVTSQESEKGYLLTKIGMRFGNKNSTLSWKEMYGYAKIYYEYHNDLEVPYKFRTNDGYTYEEDGKIRLGNWICSQRQVTSQESEKGYLLTKIGMRFGNKNSTLSWKEMYGYAKIYYEHYNDLEVPQKFRTNDGYTYEEDGKIRLGQWISSQRQKVPQESDQGHLLTKIGMRFETKKISTLSWEEMYEYARIYYEHYNDLEVSQKFRTNDGYTYEEDGKIRLGQWIRSQRQVTSKESEKGYLLTEIGMRFGSKNSTLGWKEMYEYAKIYYEHYNDLEVPRKFRTNDGYTYEEDGKIRLGNWISSQRQRLSQQSKRGHLLSEIGMRFENKNSTLSWKEMYEYAKIYYEHYNNLEVPFKFMTNDGYTPQEEGKIRLGQWISSQRRKVPPESEQGHLLTEIGMRFETKRNTLSWEETYEYAKIYYEHYNNLEVPQKFRTNDGYTYEEDGKIGLGNWISSQRRVTSKESEKGYLLTKIGMCFETKNSTLSWEEMYEYAKIYYEHYNDLEVPARFRTNDGYTYEENGKIRLGLWIINQRQNIPQKSEKIQALDEIKMNWSPRIQKEEVNNLCIDNEINIELNKTVISHISAKELKSKTTYLRANGIELTNEDGKLHEIFSMSSPDMKEKYGISLPEMIRDFYDVKQKRK
jgi:superfamily II DNA or RNA helicase